MSINIIRRLTVGVELEGDLGKGLQAREGRQLRGLLHEHGLLLFRGQKVDQARHIELMSNVGPVLHAPDGIGYISTNPQEGSLGTGELAFHSDLSFTSTPFDAISLHAIDVVDGGSSTRFVDAAAAWERLPADLKAKVARRRALSVMPVDMASDRIGERVPPGMPHQWQPVCTRHPVTGRELLYVNQQHSASIDGVGDQQSAELLRELFAQLYAPEHVFEHRWRNGDLLIWDNLLLQHARGDLQNSGTRTLQRVVVAERSFFDLCPQIDMKDPEYLRWIRSLDPAADRHLIEGVVARGAARLEAARGA